LVLCVAPEIITDADEKLFVGILVAAVNPTN
jgi:hypothetical protein